MLHFLTPSLRPLPFVVANQNMTSPLNHLQMKFSPPLASSRAMSKLSNYSLYRATTTKLPHITDRHRYMQLLKMVELKQLGFFCNMALTTKPLQMKDGRRCIQLLQTAISE